MEREKNEPGPADSRNGAGPLKRREGHGLGFEWKSSHHRRRRFFRVNGPPIRPERVESSSRGGPAPRSRETTTTGARRERHQQKHPVVVEQSDDSWNDPRAAAAAATAAARAEQQPGKRESCGDAWGPAWKIKSPFIVKSLGPIYSLALTSAWYNTLSSIRLDRTR